MTQNCPHSAQTYHFGRGGSDPEHQKHQADIGKLLDNHKQIQRQVILLDNGFSATTTSDIPEIAETLKIHVMDMKNRFAKDRAIRSWDKVYALLFAYRKEITIEYKTLSNGITSHVTTQNEALIELLHAHAKAVSGFVAKGREVSGESYPISERLENMPLHPQEAITS